VYLVHRGLADPREWRPIPSRCHLSLPPLRAPLGPAKQLQRVTACKGQALRRRGHRTGALLCVRILSHNHTKKKKNATKQAATVWDQHGKPTRAWLWGGWQGWRGGLQGWGVLGTWYTAGIGRARGWGRAPDASALRGSFSLRCTATPLFQQRMALALRQEELLHERWPRQLEPFVCRRYSGPEQHKRRIQEPHLQQKHMHACMQACMQLAGVKHGRCPWGPVYLMGVVAGAGLVQRSRRD